jgi:RNA-directed DNA polymerase
MNKIDAPECIKNQIRRYLEAGIMERYLPNGKRPYADGTDDDSRDEVNTPNLRRTPQGGPLSPLLSNIALDRLGTSLKEFAIEEFRLSPYVGKHRKYGITTSRVAAQRVCFCRYADDFVVSHSDLPTLYKLRDHIKKWLAGIRLELSPEKTKIICTTEGFDFLRFRFTHIFSEHKAKKRSMGPYKRQIIPSKASKRNFKEKVRTLTSTYFKPDKRKLKIFAKKLRALVIGWRNYFSCCEISASYQRLDSFIYELLKACLLRQFGRNRRGRLFELFFPKEVARTFDRREYKDNWVFDVGTYIGESRPNVWIPKLRWITSRKHKKIAAGKSAYDGDHDFWTGRAKNTGTLFKPSERILLQNCDSTCSVCEQAILPGQRTEIDHIVPKWIIPQDMRSTQDSYSNLQILHTECHIELTRFEKTVATQIKKHGRLEAEKKKAGKAMISLRARTKRLKYVQSFKNRYC